MSDNNYAATNLVVFTQQCEAGSKSQFDDLYDALVSYADANNLEKPKKQHLLTKILRTSLPVMSPETFFSIK